MRVFLDANLIFSAAQTGRPSRQLIEALARHATLTTHPAVWHEAERNLRAKRPDWLAGLASLKASLQFHAGAAPCPDVGLPAKDQPVLAAAIAARASRLVTGDRAHFGPLFGQTIQGTRILSTRMMAEEMQANGWIP
jgi:predicted nucleic acid-binding protein